MEEGRIDFNVKIAGIVAGIRCRYQENCDFFYSYVTGEPEAFRIEATEEDQAFSRELLRKFVGERADLYSDSYLENISLMNVLSRKLLDFNVLLIHGSALCMDGQAYIFVAPSGTGKSTHTRFWRETFGNRVQMINDDKPLVRIENGKAVVYGSPWDGKHHLSNNISAPLRAIVSLNRDTENRIEPMPGADVFPVMMRQTAWSRTGDLKLKVIGLERALMEAAAFYKLGCNMDPDAARVAWEGMQPV